MNHISISIRIRMKIRTTLATNLNVAMLKAAAESVNFIKNSNVKAIVILSASAKEIYKSLLEPVRNHLLLEIVEQLIDSNESLFGSSERKILNKYAENVDSKPIFADERKVVKLIGEKEKEPIARIIFITLSMLEELDELLLDATHLFIDEAGHASSNLIISLAAQAPKLEKIGLLGDTFQLQAYLEDVPSFVRQFGYTSILELISSSSHQHSFSNRTIKLIYSHRCHPQIISCLQACMAPYVWRRHTISMFLQRTL